MSCARGSAISKARISPSPRVEVMMTVLLAQRVQLAIQIGAHLRRVIQQPLVQDRAHGGDARRAGDRVAAKGGAVVARLEDVARAGWRASRRSAHRRPVPSPLSMMSGRDAHVFPAKELAGATHARLHLVADHHQVLLVAPRAHPCMYSALAG